MSIFGRSYALFDFGFVMFALLIFLVNVEIYFLTRSAPCSFILVLSWNDSYWHWLIHGTVVGSLLIWFIWVILYTYTANSWGAADGVNLYGAWISLTSPTIIVNLFVLTVLIFGPRAFYNRYVVALTFSCMTHGEVGGGGSSLSLCTLCRN